MPGREETRAETALGPEALHAYLMEVFPTVTPRLTITAADPMGATVTMEAGAEDLRPGDTVSGPTLFLLADVGFYVAVLAGAGRVPLAVTTSANIDFLRRPKPGTLRAVARVLKRGRRLVVGDSLIYAEASGPEPVARAGFTYAMP